MGRHGSRTRFVRSAGCAAAIALFAGTAAHAAAPAFEGRWTLVDRSALGGTEGDRGPDITLEIQGGNLSASAGCNAAERKDCVGVAPMKCLQVRQQKTDPWTLFHGEIVGFVPQPGIEYRLRIFEETVPNPPADGSSRRWVLDQVIEQRAVNRLSSHRANLEIDPQASRTSAAMFAVSRVFAFS